jgi:hypothetical protein
MMWYRRHRLPCRRVCVFLLEECFVLATDATYSVIIALVKEHSGTYDSTVWEDRFQMGHSPGRVFWTTEQVRQWAEDDPSDPFRVWWPKIDD